MAAVTVTAPVLQSITVTPANPTFPKGTTLQLTATGTYSNNSTQNLTSQVTWSSSNANVTFGATAGLAAGAVQGSSTVTATLASVSPSMSGNTTLTVGPPALVSIAVNPAIPRSRRDCPRRLPQPVLTRMPAPKTLPRPPAGLPQVRPLPRSPAAARLHFDTRAPLRLVRARCNHRFHNYNPVPRF